MDTLWICFAVLFASVTVSYQAIHSVKTSSQSPVEVTEQEEVVLKCTIKTSGTSLLFQWLLDDNVVTNGSQVSDDNYNVTMFEKRRGVYFYNLIIKQVNRTDHGRWTCKAIESSTIDHINIIVTVNYSPDSSYPMCDLQSTSVMCKTQEGNPKVSLKWFTERAEEQLNLKPSSVRTVDGVIKSEVLIESLRPPVWFKENIVCETDFGRCSINKTDVYNSTSVSIVSKADSNEVIVYCNVSNPLSDGSVILERNDTSIEGQMTQEGSHAIISFIDGGYGYRQETIHCRYLWGIMDYHHDMIEVMIPLPAPSSTMVQSTNIVTEMELTTILFDVSSTELPSLNFLSTSSNDDDDTTSETSMHTSSYTLSYTSPTDIDDYETLLTHLDDLSTAPPSPKTLRTSSGDYDDPTSEKIPQSSMIASTEDIDDNISVELTTLSVANDDVTTSHDMTSRIDDTMSSGDNFNTLLPNEYVMTTKDVTSKLKSIIKSTQSMLSTKKVATGDIRPTLPLLPPEENLSPPDWRPANITLIVLSLVAIFVISLVAVIIYQKWKEKTGSYSPPTTTSAKTQGTLSSFKHKY